MRKTKLVTIDDDGRDNGKVYLLKEMPAAAAEKWAMRALLAIAKSGVDLGEDVLKSGMAAIAVAGLQSLRTMAFEDAEPLMDEMIGCVSIIPDRNSLEFSRPLVDEDIEEIATRMQLRAEVFELHTGFSFADIGSKRT